MEHVLNGGSLLLTKQNGPDIKIFILMAHNTSVPESGILITEIIPNYLWRDPSTFILDTNLCVYNKDYLNIFCTHSETYPTTQQIKEHSRANKGDFTWQDSAEKHIASYHEIFLQPKFFTPRWLVIVSQPETEALDSLQKFNTIFWSSVILSVLLILLFSMTQIRRVLIPLEQLIDGTRRLGNHDFRTKVTVTSSDEFGELASSFNIMSEKLGDQFETLAALSKIDREILSALNIEKIAYDVLIHLQRIATVHFASISVIHDDSLKQMHVYMIDSNSKQLHNHSHVLSDNLRQLLTHNPEGIWIENELIRQQIQIDKINMVSPHLFLLPLNWKDQTVGFIALGFSIASHWKADEIKRIRDYTDRIAVALFTKNREELLIRQARIDNLTGLPNRFLFAEQLQKEIAQTRREEEKFAILYIDLDNFKKINDSLGHSAGDKLLCDAGTRLQKCIRESDTIARLGGDEFAIIISQIDSQHQIVSAVNKIINSMTKPFIINGEENVVAASIGIAIYPHDGANIADLMRNSDIAMYRAKAKTGSQYIFFEESMNTEVVRRATIERELRRAISEQQFVASLSATI
ncbi:MAG: diguanylate cyclase [Nitrosomonas sp.]|uniref:diguanylate cyclase domain-containing protein n=1 Tax=Nitrosomonas sp. TaxID=42353 RepID=UPI0025DE3BCE|nr:diguanylate cyclase [Nitrosomonas sp.]MBY0474294.1 diguanylate cyclase [Nitrosomonas sp.]